MISDQSIVHRIISNITWTLVSEIAGKGILFLVMIYLARSLGVEKFGILTFSQILATFFWYGVDLGINMYGSKEIAKLRKSPGNIVSVLLSLRVLSSFIMFLLFIGLSMTFSAHAMQRTVFLGTSLYLITRALNVDWALRGFEGFKFIAINNFATFFSMLGLTVFAVHSDRDVVKAAFIWSISYLIGSVISILLLIKNFNVKIEFVFDYHHYIIHLKQSIHFMVSGSMSMLYQYMPILIVGFMANEYQLGILSAPYKIISSMSYAFSVAPMALYPIFCNLFHTNHAAFAKLHSKYRDISILTALGFTIVLLWTSDFIILLFLGPKYLESVLIFRILTLYLTISVVRTAYGISVAAAGLQKFYTYISSAAVLAYFLIYNTVSSCFFVTNNISASYALLATESAVFLVLMAVWRLSDANTNQHISLLGKKAD